MWNQVTCQGDAPMLVFFFVQFGLFEIVGFIWGFFPEIGYSFQLNLANV